MINAQTFGHGLQGLALTIEHQPAQIKTGRLPLILPGQGTRNLGTVALKLAAQRRNLIFPHGTKLTQIQKALPYRKPREINEPAKPSSDHDHDHDRGPGFRLGVMYEDE